jgi:type IV pilus assembly protein PilX
MKLHPYAHFVHPASRYALSKQKGATLIVTIMLLLVLTILALSLYQFGNTEERSARNQFDRNLALQAAELALRDAEMDLQCLRRNPAAVPPNAAYNFCTAGTVVTAGQPALCRSTCFAGSSLNKDRQLLGFDAVGTGGLWAGTTNTKPWVKPPLGNDPFAQNTTVIAGTQTNVALPAIYQARPPRYMIEGFQQASGQLLYRITSRGWGSLEGTVVTLQEIYKP